MPYSHASIERTVALVLATGSTTGCSMIRVLDLPGPVLPGTLVAILVLLGGIFAVAWSRYAHRGDASESGAPSRSDKVA
jgi:hypothetical protein